jgi:hypothetical protein
MARTTFICRGRVSIVIRLSYQNEDMKKGSLQLELLD